MHSTRRRHCINVTYTTCHITPPPHLGALQHVAQAPKPGCKVSRRKKGHVRVGVLGYHATQEKACKCKHERRRASPCLVPSRLAAGPASPRLKHPSPSPSLHLTPDRHTPITGQQPTLGEEDCKRPAMNASLVRVPAIDSAMAGSPSKDTYAAGVVVLSPCIIP